MRCIGWNNYTPCLATKLWACLLHPTTLIGQFLSSATSASISALTADLVFAPSSNLTSTLIPATAQVLTSDYDDPPTELTTSNPITFKLQLPLTLQQCPAVPACCLHHKLISSRL